MTTPANKMRNQAIETLQFIIPIINKYNFRWVITGGFATVVHGVKRPITDIDIDIDTTRHSKEFQEFYSELQPYITQPLEHFVDQNYDNYNFEITYKNIVVDICPMAELSIYNQLSKQYELFYQNGYPETEIVDFHGIALPLLSKKMIILNKQMLVWQRDSDRQDIAELSRLTQ